MVYRTHGVHALITLWRHILCFLSGAQDTACTYCFLPALFNTWAFRPEGLWFIMGRLKLYYFLCIIWIGVITRGLFTTVIINVYGNASVWLENSFVEPLATNFSRLKIPLELGVKGYLQHCHLTSRFASSPRSALCCSLSLTVTSSSDLQNPHRMAVSGQSIGNLKGHWFQLHFGRVFQHKFGVSASDKVALVDKRKTWPYPLVASTDCEGLIIRTRFLYNRGCHILDFLSKILILFFNTY